MAIAIAEKGVAQAADCARVLGKVPVWGMSSHSANVLVQIDSCDDVLQFMSISSYA